MIKCLITVYSLPYDREEHSYEKEFDSLEDAEVYASERYKVDCYATVEPIDE